MITQQSIQVHIVKLWANLHGFNTPYNLIYVNPQLYFQVCAN